MNGLKTTIKMICDSIPNQIYQNTIEHIKHRWELCLKYKGRRLDKELLKKISKVKKDFKWRMKSPIINGIRVSYNDKFVLRIKNKDIKKKKKTQGAKKNRKRSKRKIE